MKKTFTINLGGIIFHIDEDAYQMLNRYLDSLKHHFSVMDDYQEILDDIELRIAEILQENLSETRQVITAEDINRVIRMMGQPEQIGEKAVPPEPEYTGTKKFFRDPDEKILGGVCSGIAAYFHTDQVWIRLAFILVLLMFGTGILLYLILWFIMPEARSTTDKLEMRGETITIANIERSVSEEFRELGQRIGKMANGTQETLKKTGTVTLTVFETIMKGFVEVVKIGFRILVVILGVALALAGLGLFIAITAYVTGWGGDFITADNHVSIFSLPDLAGILLGRDITFFFLEITLLILLGIPVLMLVYNGARMIFRFRRIRHLGLTVLNIWIAGLIIAAFLTLKIYNMYKAEADFRQPVKMDNPAADTLFIALAPGSSSLKYLELPAYALADDAAVIRPSKGEWLLVPRIRFHPGEDSLFSIDRTVLSRGRSYHEARQRIERMIFSSRVSGDTLFMDPFIEVPKGESWRGQDLSIEISVPEGKYVHFEKGLRNFYRFGFYSPDPAEGTTWQMKCSWLQEAETSGDTIRQ